MNLAVTESPQRLGEPQKMMHHDQDLIVGERPPPSTYARAHERTMVATMMWERGARNFRAHHH